MTPILLYAMIHHNCFSTLKRQIIEVEENAGMYSLDEVKNVDPDIADLIVEEMQRQNDHIELIACMHYHDGKT